MLSLDRTLTGPCGAVGADEPSLIVTGMSDVQVRAQTARAWRRRGLHVDRIASLLGISTSQVYFDLLAAEQSNASRPGMPDILAN